MSTLPRALHRARLWTTGLLTASTVLVGALGIHLADAHAQSVATRTSTAGGSSGVSSSFGSSGSSGSSSSSGQSGSADQSSSSDQGSSSGFSAVSPVGAGGFQAQTNSGGS